MDSDDEQNKRENSDSLEIKRERNESGSSKADENDTESDAHSGKSHAFFSTFLFDYVELVFFYSIVGSENSVQVSLNMIIYMDRAYFFFI